MRPVEQEVEEQPKAQTNGKKPHFSLIDKNYKFTVIPTPVEAGQ